MHTATPVATSRGGGIGVERDAAALACVCVALRRPAAVVLAGMLAGGRRWGRVEGGSARRGRRAVAVVVCCRGVYTRS